MNNPPNRLDLFTFVPSRSMYVCGDCGHGVDSKTDTTEMIDLFLDHHCPVVQPDYSAHTMEIAALHRRCMRHAQDKRWLMATWDALHLAREALRLAARLRAMDTK